MSYINGERRTTKKLKGLLGNLSYQNEEVENEAKVIIKKMMAHNEKLDPDTLARAALFVSKKKHSGITEDEIIQIRENGGERNKSWVTLIPRVKQIAS